jgi:hypothetical protein
MTQKQTAANRIEALHALLSGMTDVELQVFAENCKTSVDYLKQIAYGFKTASADLALLIAEKSNWKVTAHQIRPLTFRNEYDGMPVHLFAQRAQATV